MTKNSNFHTVISTPQKIQHSQTVTLQVSTGMPRNKGFYNLIHFLSLGILTVPYGYILMIIGEQVEEYEYDLFMRVDSNTRGHLQWFNFRVKGLEVGRVYKLNICNFQKGKNLYMRGMRPYCYSFGVYLNEGKGWHQLESPVKYRKKSSKSQKFLQFQSTDKYYQLSFQLSTKYPQDQLQLSYCVPYTYSRLKRYITQLVQQNQGRNIILVKKLCTSLGGHPVDELTITENVDEEQTNFKNKTRVNKKVMFITGRCHPGQANGSWMVEGLIDFLCEKTEAALFMRKNIIFKIIPMLNPDGVILGNYRTGLFGKDFNREFNNPDKDLFPEVYYLKSMFWSYKQIYRENAFIYLDFHGHSIKKNVFAYGPEYPISHKNYYQSRMIAKLLSLKSPPFRYHSCIFKIAEFKETTGRATFLKNHKIPFTFTIQASNGVYFDQEKSVDVDFDEKKWRQVGLEIMRGLYEYVRILVEIQRIRAEKLNARKQAIMKNRQKVKIKRGKNSKMGYFTSMGFRKCKTSTNQESEPLKNMDTQGQSLIFGNLMSEMGSLQMSQNFQQIFNQIKNQQNQAKIQQPEKQSDDQISQGNSDSEGSEDDLDKNLQSELLSAIKDRKKKKIGQKRVEVQTVHKIGGEQNWEEKVEGEEEEKDVAKQSTKISSKEIIVRKYVGKKKNSVFGSLSPKRQQPTQATAAKIMNFNFSLNPVECTINQVGIDPTYNIPVNMNENGFSSTCYGSRSSTNCLFVKTDEKGLKFQKRVIGPRGCQYSETFKKTFISVQKQIIRRDSHKRYLISINNSHNQSKNKKNWMIENVRGKKIGQPNQYPQPYPQLQQKIKEQSKTKSKSPQKQKTLQIKSPYRSPSRIVKNARKPQRELLIFENLGSTDFFHQNLKEQEYSDKRNSRSFTEQGGQQQII